MMPYYRNPMFRNYYPHIQSYEDIPPYIPVMIPMYPYGWEPYEAEDNLDEFDPEALRQPQAGDPPPLLTDASPQTTITLFKELTGYPGYGNPSGNADILYTGNRGAWTFNLPILLPIANFKAGLIIRAVLDDHSNVPVRRYSARIMINGSTVFNGQLPLQHGSPVGGKFTNWGQLEFNVPNIRRNNRVVIINTSETGPDDWIGLDWMEMRFTPGSR